MSLKPEEKIFKATLAKYGQNSGPYPHEVHITVDPPPTPEFYRQACRDLGVRACIFNNEFANGQYLTDYLTASDHLTTSEDAFVVMKMLGKSLATKGFTITQEKIETSPKNPLAPNRTRKRPKPQITSYYETHFDVHNIGHSWVDRLDLIKMMGRDDPVLLSVNQAKPDEFLATYRLYGVYFEEFDERLAKVQEKFKSEYDITAADTEFAVFDSNPDHDLAWFNSYR